MVFDAVSAKQAVMAQLSKKVSTEFVESWKAQARAEKAAVYGNRQRMLNEITSKTSFALTTSSPVATKEQTVESHYSACLKELRAQAGTETVEDWKCQAIERRRLIFAAHHQMVNELKSNKVQLKAQQQTPAEARQALMSSLKTNQEPSPAWKEVRAQQTCITIQNRNAVMCDIACKKITTLKNNDSITTKHEKVMSEICGPVEAWKQTIRNKLSRPLINKHQVNAEICEGDFNLKSTKSARAQTLEAIKSRNCDSFTPEWKEKIASQYATAIVNKHATVCDIAERKFTLKKIANHRELLIEIRAAYNIPESTSFVEAWKQVGRDQRAKAFAAKKNCMVSLEQEKVVLKKATRGQAGSLHAACMNAIRTQPVEAWKLKVAAIRVAAIEGKTAICQEIKKADFNLKHSKNVQANKSVCLAELRRVMKSEVEAHNEARRSQHATQLGNKHLMHLQFASCKNQAASLKKTKTVEQTKLDVMQAIRCVKSEQIPAWIEQERAERANVQNARTAVMSQLRSNKNKLENTQTLEQVKSAVLSAIRRHQEPLEAWKEAARGQQAQLYSNKRAVILAIGNNVSSLENKKSQVDLKDELLKQIRAVGKNAVPAWKEARMQARTQVMKNKIQLNAQICALGKN